MDDHLTFSYNYADNNYSFEANGVIQIKKDEIVL